MQATVGDLPSSGDDDRLPPQSSAQGDPDLLGTSERASDLAGRCLNQGMLKDCYSNLPEAILEFDDFLAGHSLFCGAEPFLAPSM